MHVVTWYWESIVAVVVMKCLGLQLTTINKHVGASVEKRLLSHHNSPRGQLKLHDYLSIT